MQLWTLCTVIPTSQARRDSRYHFLIAFDAQPLRGNSLLTLSTWSELMAGKALSPTREVTTTAVLVNGRDVPVNLLPK